MQGRELLILLYETSLEMIKNWEILIFLTLLRVIIQRYEHLQNPHPRRIRINNIMS
jgi:hypothetical protein